MNPAQQEKDPWVLKALTLADLEKRPLSPPLLILSPCSSRDWHNNWRWVRGSGRLQRKVYRPMHNILYLPLQVREGFYFLFLSFALHVFFVPEHDLSVQAALQILLFCYRIDMQLGLTVCKSCPVHCKGTCHQVFLEAIHGQLYFLSFKYSFLPLGN